MKETDGKWGVAYWIEILLDVPKIEVNIIFGFSDVWKIEMNSNLYRGWRRDWYFVRVHDSFSLVIIYFLSLCPSNFNSCLSLWDISREELFVSMLLLLLQFQLLSFIMGHFQRKIICFYVATQLLTIYRSKVSHVSLQIAAFCLLVHLSFSNSCFSLLFHLLFLSFSLFSYIGVCFLVDFDHL